MNKLITDYFAAEAAIVKRLQDEVSEVQKVLTPFSLSDMIESSQPSAALHVIYGGDVVGNSESGRGERIMVSQRWMVVLALRNAKSQLQQTSEIRVSAGIVVPKILDALQGWAPVEWMRPLSRVSGPAAGYSAAFAYFPFMFEGRIVT